MVAKEHEWGEIRDVGCSQGRRFDGIPMTPGANPFWVRDLISTPQSVDSTVISWQISLVIIVNHSRIQSGNCMSGVCIRQLELWG